MLKPDFEFGDEVSKDAVAAAIGAHFTAFGLDDSDGDVALASEWTGHPEYGRIRAFADGIAEGVAERLARGLQLYDMLDGDIARPLGNILRDELKIENEILVIDGVLLRDFDYIDLGRIRLPSMTVPVTIKSLVFSDDPRGAHRHERIHHQEDEGHGHGHGHQHGDGHHHHHHGDHDHHHSHDGEKEE